MHDTTANAAKPRFHGKTVIVTGASSGIGRTAAIEFGREGASVVLAARRLDACEETASAIRDLGGEACAIRCDITDEGDVRRLVEAAVERFGRLDCAFNNAGIAGDIRKPTHEHSLDNWNQVIATNLTSVFLAMKHEIAAMLECGGGAIVNNSSIYGLVGSNVGHVPYAASKFGVVGLTQTAAVEYAAQGIRVNAVCPGYTWTELMRERHRELSAHFERNVLPDIPMRRLADMTEIARLVLWLASDEASYVTGQAIAADGGWVAK